MRLAAILACRNQSSRLYGKPLQNLDVNRGVTILDHLVAQLRRRPEIEQVVLAISEREENRIYTRVAERLGVPFVLGDDDDVLGRLIAGANLVGAENVFRVTTESPYPYLDDLSQVLAYHAKNAFDFSTTSGLPDGSFYEVIRTVALERSWNEGGAAYRNEGCSRYIFDNPDLFRTISHQVPEALRRADDIRLTVDWPEDLIVMRGAYEGCGLSPEADTSLFDVLRFLDEHPKLNAVNNWIDSGVGRIWY